MNNLSAVVRILKSKQRFLIAAHHNPDADAVSSCLGMALLLKSLGKEARVVNEDQLPAWLTFLPQARLFKKAADVKPADYDVMLVLDCGELKRIGGVERLMLPGRPVVNIDHHVTNDRFGAVNVVLREASSTCEIVFDIIKAAGGKLNKDLAVLLYAGIMTDTGSFRYENTGPRTHAIAAELMAFGLNAARLERALYVGIPVQDMKKFTEVVHGARLHVDGRVFCVALTKRKVAAFSDTFDLKERLFGFLRSIEGIDVVVILTEVGAKETRVNLRSPGDFDVARLAAQFNGGGHRKAAGAKVYGNLAAAEKQIIAAIKKQMK